MSLRVVLFSERRWGGGSKKKGKEGLGVRLGGREVGGTAVRM